MLGFHPAPILLGFALGPQFEEDFRRAMVISRGDLSVFVTSPVCAVILALSLLLMLPAPQPRQPVPISSAKRVATA